MPFMQAIRVRRWRPIQSEERGPRTTRRFCEKYGGSDHRGQLRRGHTRQRSQAHRATVALCAFIAAESAGLSFMLTRWANSSPMIDVTLVYQAAQRPKIWSFLCGEQTAVELHAQVLPLRPSCCMAITPTMPRFARASSTG